MSATDTLAPSDELISAVIDAVRNEYGSVLCAWIDGGTQRTCAINVPPHKCRCRAVALAAIDVMNRRAPAQPFQAAMEQARDIAKIVDEDVYGDLPDGAELRDLLAQSVYARALAALTATHAKAEAEGYARGIRDAARCADTHIALSPPTASAKAGSDE